MCEGVRVNTESVRALLRKRFAAPEWALMEEVAPSTGGGTGYADAVAMNLWKSRGHSVFGIEIKVSRSDWLRELKKPAKAESVFQYCDGWYIVAPAGVILDSEMPATWGYIEVKGGRLVEKIRPPKLEPQPLNRQFVASLMRRGFEQIDQLAASRQRQAIAEARAEIDKRVEEKVHQSTLHHERAKEAIRAWEEATGLKFDTYGGPSKKIIRMAQHLEKLHFQYSHTHRDNEFGFLATMAENLDRAAGILRDALSDSGINDDLTKEEAA